MTGRRAPYLPALDGLRAAAIFSVLAYHAGLSFWRGGFIGVDLFFLLSGYLISSLMVAEYERSGRVSFSDFWMRRLLRLVPALLLFLTLFLIISFWAGGSSIGTQHTTESLVALLYATNWSRAYSLFHTDYLGHTWSLAIEAQFYLLWPLLLYRLLRSSLSRLKLAAITALLAVASWGWRLVLLWWGSTPMRLSNGLDTRLDGLLLGGALALLFSDTAARNWFERSFGRHSLLLTALALLLFFGAGHFLEWDGHSTFVWGLMSVNIAAAILVSLIALQIETPLNRLLSHPWIVTLGAISYGLYLWHYPIYRWLVDLDWGGGRLLLGVGMPLSILVSYASWRWFEKPLLQLKRHFRRG